MAGVNIPISTSEAERALKSLRSGLKAVGRSTEGVEKDVKKLQKKMEQRLGADKAKRATDELTRSLKLTKRELIAVKLRAGDVGGALGIMGGKIRSIGRSFMGLKAAIAGIGLAVFFGSIIKTGAKFEQTMAGVKGVTGATAKEFKALTGIAKKLGETTEFTATQAAEGLKFLTMAGFEVEKAIAALPGTLNLATAGQLELGEAADITTNALTAMRLGVDQLNMVNDTFVKTITTSNTDVRMLAESFKYAAPLAAGLGYDIKELSALIGLLGNAGIQGSMAGTQLNVAFQRLPKLFRKYGETVRRADGSTKGLADAIELLEKNGATAEEVMKLFAARGGRAMLAFLGMGSKAMREYQRLVEDSAGAAEKLAKTMRDTTIGAFKELMSAIEGVKISAFENQTGSLNTMIKELTKTVRMNKGEILAFIDLMATGVYGAGKAFVFFANAYTKFVNIIHGQIAGDVKKFSSDFLERQIKLAQRSYNIMLQQGNIDESVLREAEKRILTLKQRLAIKEEEILERDTAKAATDSWLIKAEKFKKTLKDYQRDWKEQYDQELAKSKEVEAHEKAASEWRTWQKQRERDATFGTKASLAEAQSEIKKYYGELQKEERKAIDQGQKYARKAEKDSWLIKLQMSKDFTAQRLEIEKERFEAEQEALKESLRWQEEIYVNFLRGIQTNFVDFFEQLYSGNLDSWQSLVDSMKSTFIRMLAEITAKQFTANIVASVTGGGGGLGSLGKLFGIGGATGGTTGIASASTTSALGLGATAAGFGMVGLTGYMGYKMIEAQRQRDARFLFTKRAYTSPYIQPTRETWEQGIDTTQTIHKTPWEAYGAYAPGGGYTGPTEIIGKSYGRGSEKGARKPVERAIEQMYEDAIEMANFYDKLTGGKAGKAFTLTPHKERFDIKDVDKELRRLGEHWADIIWDVFEPTFEEMGFKSMEALARGIEQEKDVLGNAFQGALESSSWLSFKSSIAEQIYNTISEDLTRAMIESQVFQGAMLPVYGQINKAFEAASAGGGFDLGLFRQGISGVGGALGTSFADLKPAFDEISQLGKDLREMFVGTFQSGGIASKTGLAMVHEGEEISPQGGGLALTINADVITTDNVRGWIREALEDQDNYREGRPLQRFDLQTAGINVS